jgi:hypothetical protein
MTPANITARITAVMPNETGSDPIIIQYFLTRPNSNQKHPPNIKEN